MGRWVGGLREGCFFFYVVGGWWGVGNKSGGWEEGKDGGGRKTHLMAMGRYMKRRSKVIFQGCLWKAKNRARARLPASGPSPWVLQVLGRWNGWICWLKQGGLNGLLDIHYHGWVGGREKQRRGRERKKPPFYPPTHPPTHLLTHLFKRPSLRESAAIQRPRRNATQHPNGLARPIVTKATGNPKMKPPQS